MIIPAPLLSAWCYSRKRASTLALCCCFDFISFIFHLSVNASSAFRLDQKLSVHFLCCNTEITVRACASTHNQSVLVEVGLSSASEEDFGFSGKSAVLGAQHKHSR